MSDSRCPPRLDLQAAECIQRLDQASSHRERDRQSLEALVLIAHMRKDGYEPWVLANMQDCYRRARVRSWARLSEPSRWLRVCRWLREWFRPSLKDECP